MLSKESQLARLIKEIKSLQEKNFYGRVKLQLQGGNIVLVKKSETIKLENRNEEED